MEYNELRDIMLEKNDEKKGKNTKKILMMVALLIIIFIGVLVAMKIVNTSDQSQGVAQPDSRLVLPPEPQTPKTQSQVDPQVQSKPTPPAEVKQPETTAQKKDELFEQVPIIPEGKGQDSFEEMVKSLKDKETKHKKEQNLTAEQQEPTTIQKAIEPEKKVDKKTQAPKKSESKTEQAKKPEPNITVVKPKDEPKKGDVKAEQSKKETAKTAKTDSKDPGVTPPSGTYIQVFAVSKFDENSAEIRKLKANGYSYNLYGTTVKGNKVIKVLVGPYDSKELAAELAKVKKNIASGAFIINIK
ncbi:SPOR domain-containing protein [Campylobacter sp.]|uniref:SPOR domain-containing protein n=1 Tax=Campylobacter sp. TaxID=205 RepID=UPI002700C4B5|nr:SPOR domain-containing protein [Campylobacter sp.]